tara:strand:+ start:634 stop:906 length:273 start_codon:yes stop_codon:yes gene_type:complete
VYGALTRQRKAIMLMIKCYSELEFTLIVEQIKTLPLSTQAQILDFSETLANLFIGLIRPSPDCIREQIILSQKNYHTQDWHAFFYQNKET